MKRLLLYPVVIPAILFSAATFAQNSGEELFKSVCAACHTINGGRLVGPELGGVAELRNEDWMISFIRSSQGLIKKGDSLAVAVFNEFNRIPMPDNNFSDEQIISIIKYIKESGEIIPESRIQASTFEIDSAVTPFNSEKVILGRGYFNGYKRFSNGAPPCNACHNINDQSIIGGGSLALDLTGSYSKLGRSGIAAIISNPPFPAMKEAMSGQELTEPEIEALLTLFKSLEERKYAHFIPGASGLIYLSVSLVVAIFLLVHIYILYDNRKIH